MKGEVAHEMQGQNVDPHTLIATSTIGWLKHLDKHLSMSLSKTAAQVANSWTVLRVVRRNSTVRMANKVLKFGPFVCQHNRPSMMMMKDV